MSSGMFMSLNSCNCSMKPGLGSTKGRDSLNLSRACCGQRSNVCIRYAITHVADLDFPIALWFCGQNMIVMAVHVPM